MAWLASAKVAESAAAVARGKRHGMYTNVQCHVDVATTSFIRRQQRCIASLHVSRCACVCVFIWRAYCRREFYNAWCVMPVFAWNNIQHKYNANPLNTKNKSVIVVERFMALPAQSARFVDVAGLVPFFFLFWTLQRGSGNDVRHRSKFRVACNQIDNRIKTFKAFCVQATARHWWW